MKRLTIYTKQHEYILREFAREIGTASVDWAKWRDNDRLFGVCITWENAMHGSIVEKLAVFLQDIAALENPIYKHSPKLREIAKRLQSTPAHSREVKRLKSFLKNSRTLNIEGYIAFRMSEFRHQLDIMSYRVIKKLRICEREKNQKDYE